MSRWSIHWGGVCEIRYHFVWCPKYRRPVLVDAVMRRLEEVLRTDVTALSGTILTLAIQPDHLHLFLQMPDPALAPAQIAFRLKGHSSRVLRQEFPHLRSRLPTLWSRSYFVATVGHVSQATIERYIAAQARRG